MGCTLPVTPATGLGGGAVYQSSYRYDGLGRVTNGPNGAYTYGDPAHLHGATATIIGWISTLLP